MKIHFIPLILIGSLTILSSAFAQDKYISIGARGGLSIPKIHASGDNPMSQGYASKVAAGAGVFAEFHFTKCFSIRPMIEYSGQGGKRDGMQALPNSMMSSNPKFAQLAPLMQQYHTDYLYANFKSNTSFNYLMIPVLAQFGWNFKPNSPWRVYVNAGPFVSFLLSAHQNVSGTSEFYLDKNGTTSLDQALHTSGTPYAIGAQKMDSTMNIKDQMHGVNAGFEGNVGFSYTTARHTIFIEGGGSYGLVKLQKDAANGENRIGVGTVMLGYSYRLCKKK